MFKFSVVQFKILSETKKVVYYKKILSRVVSGRKLNVIGLLVFNII